jgi:hypothetical protein
MMPDGKTRNIRRTYKPLLPYSSQCWDAQFAAPTRLRSCVRLERPCAVRRRISGPTFLPQGSMAFAELAPCDTTTEDSGHSGQCPDRQAALGASHDKAS